MSATGYLQVRAYQSYAQLPLTDVAVTVTSRDGTAIALGLTDRSGRLGPIEVPVPDRDESLSPDPAELPYTAVNLYAHKRGYERVESEAVQLFAGTTTIQNLEMVPLPELPDYAPESIFYTTPPQNL